MKKNTMLKLIIFNGILSLLAIFMFSKKILGIDIINGTNLEKSFGISFIIVSTILFFYVNDKFLRTINKEERVDITHEKIETLNDCLRKINRYMNQNIKTFYENLQIITSQIHRLKKKKKILEETLSKKFDVNELSYMKFMEPINNIENVMILNIKSLLNRLEAFDEEEYEKLFSESMKQNTKSSGRSQVIMNKRMEILKEHKDFVSNVIDSNEEMMIRLDKLIIEISKLDEMNVEEIEHLAVMKEIDELINNTKWYN